MRKETGSCGGSVTERPRLRCAVYTRKSSEEGLDQEFNSLDAQYEACLAFIVSQASLGWKLVADRYDDGGISGGTMERPALQRLLRDIRDRKIDVVVVYKIDRLTRSLMDFSRIVEIFDAAGASFVSVTQQFNTTTSMGRLTLNVLLSFAQFEREVTAERIRDKIAASKKKGIWMGGRVSLGYKVVDRKLVVDEVDAERVRQLFRRYLELGSVVALAREINASRDDGQNGCGMTRGRLAHLLSNPTYIGKLRHHGQIHDGEHEGIIEVALFEAVQARFADMVSNGRGRSSTPDIHLLTGLLFDETGDRLGLAHANNHGKRYRYYVSRRFSAGTGSKDGGWRIAAKELDRIVVQQAQELLQDQPLVAGWLQEQASAHHVEHGLLAAKEMARVLDDASIPLQRKKVLHLIFQRITLSPNGIRFIVRKQMLTRQLLSTVDRTDADLAADVVSEATFVIDREMALKRRGVETRIIVNGTIGREPDPSLVDLVARAHFYLSRLTDGSALSIFELANELGIHRADISRILPLAFLSPAIVDMILTGRQPVDLTARALSRLIDVPSSWTDQAVAIGV